MADTSCGTLWLKQFATKPIGSTVTFRGRWASVTPSAAITSPVTAFQHPRPGAPSLSGCAAQGGPNVHQHHLGHLITINNDDRPVNDVDFLPYTTPGPPSIVEKSSLERVTFLSSHCFISNDRH